VTFLYSDVLLVHTCLRPTSLLFGGHHVRVSFLWCELGEI
jgi:hypothetical protein